jgi:DNA-binding transcriptional LysR family regulator
MTLRHASLRRLQVFEAVARLRSFSRAAAELHLTQPAVSMQVRQLEDEVGLPLYEQMGRRRHHPRERRSSSAPRCAAPA